MSSEKTTFTVNPSILNRRFEALLRLPPEELLRFGVVGKGVLGFYAGRDVHGGAADERGDLVHAVVFARADVDDLAFADIRAFHRQYVRPHHVSYVREIPCLFAVSRDGHGFALSF